MPGRYRANRQAHRGANQPSSSTSRKPRPPRQRTEYTSVPAYASIAPGTAVSIVLKQDQPTGHQVQGIVADILTRGDHPRGVKVRLRDGRVGRVQRAVSEAEGTKGENLVGGPEANLGRDRDAAAGSRGGRGTYRHEKDIREDDEYLYDESRVRDSRTDGLFAALEAADARERESRGLGDVAGGALEVEKEVAVCPVCGEFEGDERAVSHHVETHFT
ncbi:hypothetical protein K458DRAFT_424958 [Lentithecium fluviatile CBS 122367]|uniref:Uncharacterized protein n=1 Tax=Lentithecium fluviatile CBS 122367 TaxID=1168545 RepID=A0A6G1IDC0_9PLEO|nr:hypothetical protein K458DRAFT_424958 [Lentithecium fluviatile CBS 122367]